MSLLIEWLAVLPGPNPTPTPYAPTINHTGLCLASRSWSSFTEPGGMEGWVGLGTTTVSEQSDHDRHVTWHLSQLLAAQARTPHWATGAFAMGHTSAKLYQFLTSSFRDFLLADRRTDSTEKQYLLAACAKTYSNSRGTCRGSPTSKWQTTRCCAAVETSSRRRRLIVATVVSLDGGASGVVVWSPHEQQAWQNVEEDRANPARHRVGARSSEIPIGDRHRKYDRQDVH